MTATDPRDPCPHDSQSGDEGPVALLGRQPRRWTCDSCGEVLEDPQLLAERDDQEICSCTIVGTGMCAMPATYYATAGCVHEHVGTKPLCDYHGALARDRDPAIMSCGYCRKAGHACDLLIADVRPIGEQR